MDNVDGFCKCGCGGLAPISSCTILKKGYVKGKPRKYIRGHNPSTPPILKGEKNPRWNGRRTKKTGYPAFYCPEHPRADMLGYVIEHIVIAEKALGKYLPSQAVIHHADENIENNSNSNLVICENRAYLLYLHQRLRAFNACGHTDWRKCWICKNYDEPKNLTVKKAKAYHKACAAKRARERKLRNEGE
jgi:hypothetical protein